MSIETSLMILAICALFFSLCALIFIGFAIAIGLRLSKSIDVVSDNTKRVLQDGSEIADKIKDNLDATKPMFHSIAKVGSMVNEFTEKVSDEFHGRTFKKIVSNPPTRRRETKVLDFLELLSLGILMWKKYKKGADNE